MRLALKTGPSACGIEAPLSNQMWRGKGDGADVIAVYQCEEYRPDNQINLESAKATFVK